MKTQNRLNKRLNDCMQNLLSYHSIQYFCFAFVPRTIFFLCFGGLAYAGWLESYITPTTWIGIFALWILILFYPPKNQINVWGTYSIILLTLAFTSIIYYENLTLSFYQWSFILLTHFLTLKLICKSSAIFTKNKSANNTQKNTKKYILVLAILLLIFWFFYPNILNYFSPNNLLKDPYENLETLLTGGALIATALTVHLQTRQIAMERQKNESEYAMAKSNKIDGHLYDCWMKYEVLRKECGKEHIDTIYQKIDRLYWQINGLWAQNNDEEIDIDEIISEIRFYYEQTNDIFCLSAPFIFFINILNQSKISDKEQSQYYSRFISLLPKKEKAIILTYILCCEESCNNIPFFSMKKETLYLLFDTKESFSNTTETFINVVRYIIGYFYHPHDADLHDLHELILKAKEDYAKRDEKTYEILRKLYESNMTPNNH